MATPSLLEYDVHAEPSSCPLRGQMGRSHLGNGTGHPRDYMSNLLTNWARALR